MSRGGKGNFQRGNNRQNRTLAWYMGVDNNQERENTYSPVLNKRKNSLDSEGSNNERQSVNENEEHKKRANKAKGNRQRSQNSQSDQVSQNTGLNVTDNERSNPIPIGRNASSDALVGSDQQAAVLQQQLLALTAQAAVQKENYWYYDPSSDGYFYEFCGSRGWKKRNQKLHGNPPNVPSKLAEEHTQNVTQTIEKVKYVPIPVFVPQNNKFFSPGTSPNIKYFDSNGFYYETPHAEIWKKRSSTIPSAMHQHNIDSTHQQRSKVEPSSLTSFPPLGRDYTNQELEDLILAKVKNTAPNQLNNQSLQFSSIVSRNLKNNGMQNQRQPEPVEYPSSSSTVSSAVSDDTPPPVPIGKENQCQQLFAQQTKEPCVGSFEEPYEFYWSDSEKTDNVQQEASSVSSMDDYNPLSAYLNDVHVSNPMDKLNIRVQRPSSLKIINPNVQAANDKRLPRFNVDKFIAELPGNDNNFMNGMSGMYAPFGADSPRTPFHNSQYIKESPMFTPMIKERPWRHFPTIPVDDVKEKASADIERGLRDIEKIWSN